MVNANPAFGSAGKLPHSRRIVAWHKCLLHPCLFARIDRYDIDTVNTVVMNRAAVIIFPSRRVIQVPHPYGLEDANMSMGVTGAAVAKGCALIVNIAVYGDSRFGEKSGHADPNNDRQPESFIPENGCSHCLTPPLFFVWPYSRPVYHKYLPAILDFILSLTELKISRALRRQ